METTTQTLSVTVSITVLKSAADVFRAVLTPVPFFVEKASGPLAEGKTIQWQFPEMDMQVPVIVESVVPNESVRLEWDAEKGRKNTVEFRLSSPREENPKADAVAARQGVDAGKATTLTITESGWPGTEAGRGAALQNNTGWTHYACCLKAHLEHGVNLRKGAFLHYKFPE
jgi:uncharacterized protein YndB with AHSA1/START domain